MIERIIIAGAGGQGIMLLGKVLAEAAMRENKFVTWLPAYGAEVRGGTAHCMVVISDKEIGSPYIDKADALIVMNEPSLRRFKNRLKDKGLLIANSSLIFQGINGNMPAFAHPFTDIAVRLGNIRVANMVALGSFLARRGTVNPKTVFEVMKSLAPPDKKGLLEINHKALEEGMRLA